jgi:hypothetical protein
VRGTWSEAWEAVVRLDPDFLHVANALGYGATPEEITEVMEITAVLGVHAVTTSAPLLAEELAARAESPAPE